MEHTYQAIADDFLRRHDDVAEGRMMIHPALTRMGKVFAFDCRGAMVFKLGHGADPGVPFTFLHPSPTRAPMKAWFQVEAEHAHAWRRLTQQALETMRGA